MFSEAEVGKSYGTRPFMAQEIAAYDLVPSFSPSRYACRTSSRSLALIAGAKVATYSAIGPSRPSAGAQKSAKDLKSMRIVSISSATSTKPACRHARSKSPGRLIGRVHVRARKSLALESSTAAVSRMMRCATSPPRESHVAAATTPPGRVTRRISRMATSECGMNCKTSIESV